MNKELMIAEALIALKEFENTNSREGFRIWLQKYNSKKEK